MFKLANCRYLGLLVLPALPVAVVVPGVVVLHHPLEVVVGRLAVGWFGGRWVSRQLALDPDELLLVVVAVGVVGEAVGDGGQGEDCNEGLREENGLF